MRLLSIFITILSLMTALASLYVSWASNKSFEELTNKQLALQAAEYEPVFSYIWEEGYRSSHIDRDYGQPAFVIANNGGAVVLDGVFSTVYLAMHYMCDSKVKDASDLPEYIKEEALVEPHMFYVVLTNYFYSKEYMSKASGSVGFFSNASRGDIADLYSKLKSSSGYVQDFVPLTVNVISSIEYTNRLGEKKYAYLDAGKVIGRVEYDKRFSRVTSGKHLRVEGVSVEKLQSFIVCDESTRVDKDEFSNLLDKYMKGV